MYSTIFLCLPSIYNRKICVRYIFNVLKIRAELRVDSKGEISYKGIQNKEVSKLSAFNI